MRSCSTKDEGILAANATSQDWTEVRRNRIDSVAVIYHFHSIRYVNGILAMLCRSEASLQPILTTHHVRGAGMSAKLNVHGRLSHYVREVGIREFVFIADR